MGLLKTPSPPCLAGGWHGAFVVEVGAAEFCGSRRDVCHGGYSVRVGRAVVLAAGVL